MRMQKHPNRFIIPSKLFKKSSVMTERDIYFQVHHSREGRERITQRRVLLTMPYGIGDAVYIGLSAVDQITRNDSFAKIDVLCNSLQYELFSYDPRINTIITAQRALFPTPENFTVWKALSVDSRSKGLIRFLRDQNYDAVLPANSAFLFAHRLGAKVLYPNPLSVLADYQTIRSFGDAPAERRIRAIINRYFGNKLPAPEAGEPVTLYIDPAYMVNAKAEMADIRARANMREKGSYIIVISPDTTSLVTRPPTELFADGLTPILTAHPETLVYILPSYTDEEASKRLYTRLSPTFGPRIQCMPSSPRPSLVFTSIVVDQADMLITGDTGIMHLAAAVKVVNEESDNPPRNRTKIVAIFGGTNPGLYGYHLRTKIVGRGNKEQKKIRPGFLKEGYDPKGRDYFSHVSSGELTQAIKEELDYN